MICYSITTKPNQVTPEFQFGETTYAHGLRNMTNSLYAYLRMTSERYSRDIFIEGAGLNGKVSPALLKTIFDHVDADIDHRNNTGDVLPVRGGIIGAEIKLDGRALN